MEMVYVPRGPFIMGLEDPTELSRSHAIKLRPPEIVELPGYWIDKTEVTNQMYARCVAAGVCQIPITPVYQPYLNYFENPFFGDYPVLGVSFEDAKIYCQWVDRRLPTEAEWEKAARGVGGDLYPWGNDYPNCKSANYLLCNDGTLPVGSLPAGASPYGVLDLAGNVWEWVDDWYDKEFYPTPFPVEGEVFSETLHVVRGGSWTNGTLVLESGIRFIGWPIDEISVGFGFRCVGDIESLQR
jgi:serine/threonine-protein kinase